MSRPQNEGVDAAALLALRRMSATGVGCLAEVEEVEEREEDDEEDCPSSVSSNLGLLGDIPSSLLSVADLRKTLALAAASAWRAPAAVEELEVSLGEFIVVMEVVEVRWSVGEVVEVRWSIGSGGSEVVDWQWLVSLACCAVACFARAAPVSYFGLFVCFWWPAVPWPVLLGPHPCLTCLFVCFLGFCHRLGLRKGKMPSDILLEILISACEPHDKEDAI